MPAVSVEGLPASIFEGLDPLLKKDSSAGSIVDRVKKQLLKDKQFRNKLAGIKKIISKS